MLRACLHGGVAEICELNFALGERFAAAALAAIRRAGLRPGHLAAIGSHGQTLHHLPHARHPSTLQIGEPCVIAERTGITTVADFRVRDMAAGGQGAPLVPYTDWALFTHATRPRVVQNIGGIGNLTFLPPRAAITDVLAFDTGPGNMIMDAVVTQLTGGKLTYDRGGRLAARGRVSAALLAECLKHPFIRRRPPKTTGREEFGEPFVNGFLTRARQRKLSPNDIVATATAFTAETIADAYRRFVFPRLTAAELARVQIILGGGGAKNPTLRRLLAERGARGITNPRRFWHSRLRKSARVRRPRSCDLARPALQCDRQHRARRAVVLGKIVPGNGELPCRRAWRLVRPPRSPKTAVSADADGGCSVKGDYFTKMR